MRFILFLLLAVTISVAHAEPDKNPVYAVVENKTLLVYLRGQVAKDIFDSMPEDSRLVASKKCMGVSPSETVKVRGGFICVFSPKLLDDLYYAYVCNLEVLTKTGKVLLRNPKNYCDREEP